MPSHVVEQLLSLAVLEPTPGRPPLGGPPRRCGLAAGRLYSSKHLDEPGLGTRRQRIARAALVAASAGCLMTEAARDAEPMGVRHMAAGSAELVSLDSFYIGNLKGVGRVYQLTAVDVFTRWAVVAIIVGTPTGIHTAGFVADLIGQWRRHGYLLRAVVTENGPEFGPGEFRQALADRGTRHVRIPARSPNHNALVERFHGTVLQECRRPAFHRRRCISRHQLHAAASAWLIT
jgi:transposase InsO family protein